MTPRVGHFLRLLGSDKDGEVVAAARALGRALHAEGKDFHWLTAVLDRAVANPALTSTRPWQVTASECLRRGGMWGDLTQKEVVFLRSMTTWLGKPTSKQQEWLDALATRFEVAA